jgi:copper chaperone
MSCKHCVAVVRGALLSVIGVNEANVDLARGKATVTHNADVALDALKVAVEDQGYDVVS